MSQSDLDQVIGYVLKRTQAVLRARMDEALRPLGLTTPQYVCLEILSRSPGLSNSDLARSAFVTRQTMNTLLRGLQERGLVLRADRATAGRALPATLSAEGAAVLESATRVANAIDAQMVSGLTPGQRGELQEYLMACIGALDQPVGTQPTSA